ncbi:DUF1905 domain-containing protein [Nocardia uniformis]|uniref:DUF1905 domain-containing protein n=1 Tax=Nocardia uniformis TaxID=53432 RepID=A0A849C2P1_9NOCA|nr:YdeI/OmpD-associated family protein [Nocardia uniformis]NNH72952.1 DUF1905 domain-containing protein [Nocardia uniformis]
MTISFDAPVERIGERIIVRLPDDASSRLPSRGQVAVDASAGQSAFRTVLEPDGRRGHWLRIDEELQRVLEVGEGDVMAVEIEPAEDWPEPDVPSDFRAALDNASDGFEVWTDITPMARWEWVRWIGATKNPQTRERRIEVGISKLRAGKRRPCCFDLASCTDPEVSKSGKLIDAS